LGGEADRALEWLRQSPWVRCRGLHVHIGTGVHQADDYRRALLSLKPLVERSRRRGITVPVLDVGGGFGARTSREMTQLEMLVYQGIGRIPTPIDPVRQPTFEDFAKAITNGLKGVFGRDLPELLLEPGRSIVSSSQLLLLTVHAVKDRPGAGKWLVTDGGLGTVTMPTFYEYHELLLANDPYRPRIEKVTITGPVCFSGDVVYRNKAMPPVEPGEVLAVMDSGAYFTALESSFGFPRPAIIVVGERGHRLIRRRETFSDMNLRDELDHSREDP
jgi:diaminopimelate decarboxylase